MPRRLRAGHAADDLLLSGALALVLAAAPQKIVAGPLTLELSSSEAAQQFHVVDQLSQWSPFSHQQYRRALKLDADDEAALEAHAELRKRLAYGALDQAFHLSASLDEASTASR